MPNNLCLSPKLGWTKPGAIVAEGEEGMGWVAALTRFPFPSLSPALLLPLQLWWEGRRRLNTLNEITGLVLENWRITYAVLTHFFGLYE